MSISYVISMVGFRNNKTNPVKYFQQFDAIGNVITTSSVYSAYNFGVDISSARYVRNHILREYALTGEDLDYLVNVVDVYLETDSEK